MASSANAASAWANPVLWWRSPRNMRSTMTWNPGNAPALQCRASSPGRGWRRAGAAQGIESASYLSLARVSLDGRNALGRRRLRRPGSCAYARSRAGCASVRVFALWAAIPDAGRLPSCSSASRRASLFSCDAGLRAVADWGSRDVGATSLLHSTSRPARAEVEHGSNCIPLMSHQLVRMPMKAAKETSPIEVRQLKSPFFVFACYRWPCLMHV